MFLFCISIKTVVTTIAVKIASRLTAEDSLATVLRQSYDNQRAPTGTEGLVSFLYIHYKLTGPLKVKQLIYNDRKQMNSILAILVCHLYYLMRVCPVLLYLAFSLLKNTSESINLK